jgi:hypothetical protein
MVKAYERYNETTGVNRQLSLRLGDAQEAADTAPAIASA